MTYAQRALWTFLIYALVGPFFAALAVVVATALASALGLATLLGEDVPAVGSVAIGTFVWSGVPAAVTGLALAGLALRSGGFGWLVAAAAAVVAFALAAAVLPFGFEEARPYLAFLAGLVSIAVRAALVRTGIITV